MLLLTMKEVADTIGCKDYRKLFCLLKERDVLRKIKNGDYLIKEDWRNKGLFNEQERVTGNKVANKVAFFKRNNVGATIKEVESLERSLKKQYGSRIQIFATIDGLRFLEIVYNNPEISNEEALEKLCTKKEPPKNSSPEKGFNNAGPEQLTFL